ncbi:MAG: glycerol-3-phosphate dehydrogenase [Woeseia sp.]
MTSSPGDYDVVIIGGGINGAGVARDAAMRGLKVLLLEQNDFGSGTSSWSSRLIHGGLRYLEYGEIPLVYESLHERRVLRSTASHLVKKICINIPVYEHSKRGMWLLRAGMIAYDFLSLGKSLPRHRVLNREAFLRMEPGVNPSGLRGGVQYFDAQVTYAERLVVENIIAAAKAGASVQNYSPVTAIDVQHGRVERVRYLDRETARESEARAKVVVNAAGPWVDRVLATANVQVRKLMGGTKGSHIIVGRFAGAPKGAFYVEARSDARPFFIIPWNDQFLIGTTDIRYDGDPDEATASVAEIRYLMSETNRVFPEAHLREQDIHYAYAGVRPLPYQSAGPESAITRKHIIQRHGNAKGLWSIIGGKLTTYRSLSEQITDRLVKETGLRAAPCRTGEENLPGATNADTAEKELRDLRGLSPAGKARLSSVYGGRISEILELAHAASGPLATADPQQSVLTAEVQFAIRHEFARNLVDLLHRRTMTGLAPDLGASVATGIARAAADELRWDETETERQLAALHAYNARLAVLKST